MKINVFNTLSIFNTIFKKDENNRIINIYKLNDCILTGLHLFYPNILIHSNNDLILPVLEKTMSLQCGSIYEKHNMEFNFKKTIIKNTYTQPLFFFVYNTDNYYHFLYDTLPYLISYLHLKKKNKKIKLLMQYPNPQKKKFYPFILEFLDILNIKQTDIILLNNNTLYSEIYISNSYTHDRDSNAPPRKEIFSFYKNIVSSLQHITINTPKKIYISRRTWLHNNYDNIGTNYTTRRKLINENTVIEKLKKEGFTEIFTENLSTIEKIKYFSNATHIKGAIGGGIANVLFSPKSTILEAYISPYFLDINKRFTYCLNTVNVYYNKHSEHFEKTIFKKYMRVKTKDNKIIGEIENIIDNDLLISYTDGSNTGWNHKNKYNKIIINKKNVIALDNGLNSAWVLLTF